jgi:iron complex outermembrane receptor protein
VRASLVVDVTDEIENYSIFSYSNSDENGDVQKLVGCNPNPSLTNLFGLVACGQLKRYAGGGFYTVQNTLPSQNQTLKTFQGINTTTWNATDNVTVKNILSYAQLKDDLNTGLFGTDFDAHDFLAGVFPKGSAFNFSYAQPVGGGDTGNESTFTEELQAQGSAWDSRLIYQGGVYVELADPLGLAGETSPVLAGPCTNVYTRDCTNPLGAILGSSGLNGTVNYTAGRQRSKDVGVYSQATYSLTDQLKLTGGVRYTWDNETDQNDGITYNLPYGSHPLTPSCTNVGTSGLPDCSVSYKESSRAPTWLLDLDYKPTDKTLLYAKYARGYRGGGITPVLPSPFNTFHAERVDNFEVGIKQTFLGALNGLLDADGFYNKFSNQQLQVGFDPAPGHNVSPAAGIINAGKSQIYGAEVDASVTPFPGFTADLDYTYLRTNIQAISTFTAPPDSPYVLVTQANVGDRLVLSPTNKLTVSGTYTLPLDPSLGKVSLGASFAYTDPQLANYADAVAVISPGVPNYAVRSLSPLQARHILNLNFDWSSIAGSQFDLSVFATNVTNDKYYTFVAGLYSSNLGFETAELGEPAFYGARVRFHFGVPPTLPPAPPAEAPVAPPPPPVAAARMYLVFFDWDRADLTARAREIVAAAAASSTHEQTRIEVNGYTDRSGTPAYNQKLSVRRAETVQSELVRDGVAPGEISIHGYGENNPLVPTAQGVREPQNRRVEIILM